MPANKKYLNPSGWTKASKFLAGFLGGLITLSFVTMAFSVWGTMDVVLSTALYSSFIIWPLLMLLVYWIKKAWVSWALLGGISLIAAFFFYLGNA
ncbi:MAG: hypothetical protein AAFQ98_16395 [Bacteroidota bacterium]